MKQARFLNSELPIYLLTDQKWDFDKEFFELERIDLVEVDRIFKSEEHKTFTRINRLTSLNLNGLWSYAMERFFFLYDFIAERNLKNVIHLENDTLLYFSLEEMLSLFQDLQFAAPFQSSAGCIPSLVWIKEAKSLKSFLDYANFETENYTGFFPQTYLNDMYLLARFYKRFGGKLLTPLPTLMANYELFFPKKKSLFFPDNQTELSFLSLTGELFPGFIFDAAGLGIFMNGNDRRYAPDSGNGVSHRRLLFEPNHFSYYWGCDKKGRRVPYLSFKGVNYRIANLHFHSKMCENYTSYDPMLLDFPFKR